MRQNVKQGKMDHIEVYISTNTTLEKLVKCYVDEMAYILS